MESGSAKWIEPKYNFLMRLLNFNIFSALVLLILLLKASKNHWYFIRFALSNNFWFFYPLSYCLKEDLIESQKEMIGVQILV